MALHTHVLLTCFCAWNNYPLSTFFINLPIYFFEITIGTVSTLTVNVEERSAFWTSIKDSIAIFTHVCTQEWDKLEIADAEAIGWSWCECLVGEASGFDADFEEGLVGKMNFRGKLINLNNINVHFLGSIFDHAIEGS